MIALEWTLRLDDIRIRIIRKSFELGLKNDELLNIF